MKFFAVFACVVAAAFASPNEWTLTELSAAASSANVDPALKPAVEQALNTVMEQLFNGAEINAVSITTQAGVAGTFTLAELDYAIQHAGPATKPYLQAALDQLMASIFAGEEVQYVTVYVPAMELSFWTLAELDAALTSPDTSAFMIPYLEHALNELMAALFAGQSEAGVVVAMPVQQELIPVPSPSPVVVPSPSPVVVPSPSPVTVPSPANSPLVQIIVNVASTNTQEAQIHDDEVLSFLRN